MKKFAGDIIISHMCTKNDNHMMHSVSDNRVRQTEFLSFWTAFFLFYPPMDTETQNFENMKQTLEDIIILQM